MEKLPAIEKLIATGFKEEECKSAVIYHPTGCSRCNKGYKGRFALLEALELDDEMRRMIIRGDPVMDIKNYAVTKANMITLRRCGILNILRGKTSIEEVLRMTEL